MSDDDSRSVDRQQRARRKPGENRERLILAGIRQFALYGYHGTSTSAIGAAADVPQPHIYANFSTKHALFVACVERVCHLLQSAASDGSNLKFSELDDAKMLVLQALVGSNGDGGGPAIVEALQTTRAVLGDTRFVSLLGEAAFMLFRE